jgi:soluble lytic murein transglycosylase-like protein
MGLVSLSARIAAGWCLLGAVASVRAADPGALDALLDAIAKVESNDNPVAVGDGGRAAGKYQIHRSYWADGTRILGVNWKYEDATDPYKARQVVRAYLSHYGRGKSLTDLARIHNGGPQGDRNKATLAYARKVTSVLPPRTSANE